MKGSQRICSARPLAKLSTEPYTAQAITAHLRRTEERAMFNKNVVMLAGLISITTFMTAASRAATTRSGAISRFDGIDEVVFECTTSTTFLTIPQMTRSFRLGGTTTQPVVVMFQGAFNLDAVDPFDTGYIQLVIDGVPQGPGNQVPAKSPAGVATSTAGFNWQTRPLTVGSHTARIRWRTDLGGNFCVDTRSLIVLHK